MTRQQVDSGRGGSGRERSQRDRGRGDGRGRRNNQPGGNQPSQPTVSWNILTLDQQLLGIFSELELSKLCESLFDLSRTSPAAALAAAHCINTHRPSPANLRWWSFAGDVKTSVLSAFRPTTASMSSAEENLEAVRLLSRDQTFGEIDIRDILGPIVAYHAQLYGLSVQRSPRIPIKQLEQMAIELQSAADGYVGTGQFRRQAEARFILGDILYLLRRFDQYAIEILTATALYAGSVDEMELMEEVAGRHTQVAGIIQQTQAMKANGGSGNGQHTKGHLAHTSS